MVTSFSDSGQRRLHVKPDVERLARPWCSDIGEAFDLILLGDDESSGPERPACLLNGLLLGLKLGLGQQLPSRHQLILDLGVTRIEPMGISQPEQTIQYLPGHIAEEDSDRQRENPVDEEVEYPDQHRRRDQRHRQLQQNLEGVLQRADQLILFSTELSGWVHIDYVPLTTLMIRSTNIVPRKAMIKLKSAGNWKSQSAR